MKQVTNNHQIDLALAVWLMQNGYDSGADKAPEGELISVTTLMKPTRRLILERQVDQSKEKLDIADLIPSRIGHSLHEAIEASWTQSDWATAMRRLHYPERVIQQIKINPDPSTVTQDDIPIYLEQRGYKEINGIVLTGKLDFAINGAYRDFKTTSTFSYTSGSKDQDYILQGSMYRYLMPEYIWKDQMRIDFVFTDWQSYRANRDINYPQTRIAHKDFPLMSHEETEEWIVNKINQIKDNAKYVKNQNKMIRCSDKDLWIGDPVYKYYSNPETAKKEGRPQKIFQKLSEAEQHRSEKGKGIVVTVKGKPKACQYCSAFSVCEQRKEYFPDVT